MSCAHAYVPEDGGEGIFAIDASSLTFGRGALGEVGAIVRGLGCKRVAVFTDARVAKLEWLSRATKSLRDATIDLAVYDAVHVEPTDASFLDAARFAREGRFDGYVSVGGGSVIDTCKAAALYATHPRDFLAFVNKPVGAGEPVPGALPPHVACPTTSGTGSELTGIAVCDVLALRAKTGIASRRLRPTFAVVDPDVTATLPASVVAASGFDVLCHALESYTARPFRSRVRPASPSARPMSQGRNPWSDLGSVEALRLCGKYLVRAVRDASDAEAREQMMWAATLAGVAFGNSGVHVPHAMAYAVAGLVRDFRMPGYPDAEPPEGDAPKAHGLVPHGVSVVLNAPAVFRWTESACPERHREAARLLGDEDAARALERLMRDAAVPIGLASLGYGDADVGALVGGTIVQRRLLDNAPREVGEAELASLFASAMRGAAS